MAFRPALAAAFALAGFVAGGTTLALPAAALQALAVSTCSSTTACTGAINTSSGSGVLGRGTTGAGVVGSSPSSGSGPAEGVLGIDGNKIQPDTAGVKGTSTRGYGVYGISPKGEGVYGRSTTGAGVRGDVSSTSANLPAYGVLGYDYSYVSGSAGGKFISDKGVALLALTEAGKGATAAALKLQTFADADLLQAAGPSNASVTIDSAGNITTTGKVTTSGSCSSGCIVGKRGVRSYAAMAAAPSLEDTGEAQLRDGVAIVALDPAFASAIDRRAGYYVLITPEGETRGLYVAQRSPSQFVVRENAGGRTSVPFAYRLVARPYGDASARLPFVK